MYYLDMGSIHTYLEMQNHAEVFLLKTANSSICKVVNFKMPMIGILTFMTRAKCMLM